MEKKDACPRCLDKLNVVVGKVLSSKRETSTHANYKFMCPECEHIWTCLFSIQNFDGILSPEWQCKVLKN